MVRIYIQYHSKMTNSGIPPLANWKDGVDFAMLFPLWASLSATTQHVGKAGGLQILRCRGFEVKNYDSPSDALTLKPSVFCSVGVNYAEKRLVCQRTIGTIRQYYP
jgi:hypothetical protein